MRPTLDIRGALVAALPEIGMASIRAAAGRKYVKKRQDVLCHLALQAYSGERAHRLHPEASSFACTTLREDLQVKDHKPLLRKLFEFTETNGRYSKERALTKEYRLRPNVRSAVQSVMQKGAHLAVLDADSGIQLTRASLPKNGIPEGVDDRLTVPPVVSVPMVRVESAIYDVVGQIDCHGEARIVDADKAGKCTLGKFQNYLYICRRWIGSPLEGIPNIYKGTSTGRLGPAGFHVIQLPAVVRRVLFEGSGLSDYDIESAHFNIFRSRASSLGFSTPRADEYVASKTRYHEQWMYDTGHLNAADFKATATSWLNGGTLSESLRTATGKRLGRAAIAVLKQDAFASALRQEARDGMMHIVEAMTTDGKGDGETTYTNAVGASISVSKPLRSDGLFRHTEFGRLCAHVLTGYEQWAIREACAIAEGLEVIIYDGVIASEGQKQRLADHIRCRSIEVLGFPLELPLKEQSFDTKIVYADDDSADF